MKKVTITIFALMSYATQALACSGSGAEKTIETSISIGYYCAFGSVALVILTLLMNRKTPTKTTKLLLTIASILTILHPGFWMSATSGDCGIVRLYTSITITVLSVLILALVFIKNNRTSKSY